MSLWGWDAQSTRRRERRRKGRTPGLIKKQNGRKNEKSWVRRSYSTKMNKNPIMRDTVLDELVTYIQDKTTPRKREEGVTK